MPSRHHELRSLFSAEVNARKVTDRHCVLLYKRTSCQLRKLLQRLSGASRRKFRALIIPKDWTLPHAY